MWEYQHSDGVSNNNATIVVTVPDACAFVNCIHHSCSNSLLLFQVLKDLHEAVCDGGMVLFCVVSKADQVDGKVAKDISRIAFSESVHRLRQCIRTHAGIPMNQDLLPFATSLIPISDSS